MQQIKKTVEQEAKGKRLNAFSQVYLVNKRSRIRYWLSGIILFSIIALLLPWTQNIKAKGTVTTLRQEQRPQELNTIIAGRIIKWYVREGDFVRRGDTVAQLAEIKDNYLDPQLLERTQEQMEAKSSSISAYNEKARVTTAQMEAIQNARALKIQQLHNKIQQLKLKVIADSMEAVAADNYLQITEEQYRRQKIMRDSGLASLVQLEQRNQAYQSANAKKISADIKFTNTKTDLINTSMELQQVEQEYIEKIFKAQGDRAASQSEAASGIGELSKLSNQYSNYKIRAGQYYILAPQDGQVVNASKAGINEVVKEGEKIVDIVPTKVDLAVEIFVRPVDVPLLSIGQNVRFMFDGFPAIVFSGWPAASYGTFSGKIVAIENSVGTGGKFRILVGENENDRPWPKQLRMGAGAEAIALLKNVPVWYELWRNINGFPPDFYQPKKKQDDKKKY